jgi:uncharacterized membrane protein YedE/YeeE
MMLLPDRLPLYLAGPAIGLLVVALYALANRRLGVTQSYAQIGNAVRGLGITEPWRLWWFGGMALGALGAGLLRDGPNLSVGYGTLGLVLPATLLVPVLFLGGILMGYGARWAGGCTSGHGISGNAGLSKASFVATGVFMVTAIAITFAIHFLSGGAL